MKKGLKVIERSDYNLKGGELFQRMGYLFSLSGSLYKRHPTLSRIYNSMMTDISKRNALRTNSKYKRLICKCNNLLFLDEKADLRIIRNGFF